jgi:hypothetical protein
MNQKALITALTDSFQRRGKSVCSKCATQVELQKRLKLQWLKIYMSPSLENF